MNNKTSDSVRKTSKAKMRQENVHTDIFTPRTYQVELLDGALQKNTIVCLSTGTGKTFIAVMLIKELAYQIRPPFHDGGKRSVFLVPSVPLVEQQAKVISMHTDLTVGEYHGAMGVDFWTEEHWEEEFVKNQVLVMTAQVFLDILHHGFIGLSKVNLIIFDECHRAVKNDPYVQIMKCHDVCPPGEHPRILGLTASILNSNCKSPVDLDKCLSDLENVLKSIAETATDMVIPDMFCAKPKEIILECEDYHDKTGLIKELGARLEATIFFLQDCSMPFDPAIERDPKLLPKTVLTETLAILNTLGPWCAGKVAQTLARQVNKIAEHEALEWHRRYLYMALTQLVMLSTAVDQAHEANVYSLEEFLDYTSPQVVRLLEIVKEYKPNENFQIIGDGDYMDGAELSDDSMELSDEEELNDFFNNKNDNSKNSKANVHYVAKRTYPTNVNPEKKEEEGLCGLVFVERRHVAFALNKLLQELCNWDPDLYFLQSSHITGHGMSKERDGKNKDSDISYKKQEEVLRKFRQKEINLLIATSVLEEGIDVPKCNVVVRFNLPNSYRSYVQSKGRARAAGSRFIMLVPKQEMEHFMTEMKIFKGIEKILTDKCHDGERTSDDGGVDPLTDTLLPPYMPRIEDGAPRVTLTSAIALVNKYCAKLPSDAFTHLTPKCKVKELGDGQFQATLSLPINSPIKTPIVGEIMTNKKCAKMAVALKTSEILHKAGELDEHLLPVGKEVVRYEDEENEWEETEAQGQARPGTTKRKQYYYKKVADALCGHPTYGKSCCLYNIHMALTCPITEEQNTRGRKIHAPEETPRCFGLLSEKLIPLVPNFPVFTRSGEVTVSVELVTSDIVLTKEEFSRLEGFHQYVFRRVLRLEKDPMTFDYENTKASYLIVPLNRGLNLDLIIDWEFISAIESSSIKKDPTSSDESFEFRKADFDDAVVMPSYRNIDQPQYFYVAEIRYDLTPNSPFPSPELYKTFLDYYTIKYNLAITNPNQPLLDVDHTSARLNLLTPRYMNQKGVALPTSSAETRRARRENLQQKQILVPELCDIHPFPASLWRKAVCLPAILYRTNYLLIAEELRVLIANEAIIGVVHLSEDYRFPPLEFGFSTIPQEESKDTAEKGNTTPPPEGMDTELENGTTSEEDNMGTKDTTISHEEGEKGVEQGKNSQEETKAVEENGDSNKTPKAPGKINGILEEEKPLPNGLENVEELNKSKGEEELSEDKTKHQTHAAISKGESKLQAQKETKSNCDNGIMIENQEEGPQGTGKHIPIIEQKEETPPQNIVVNCVKDKESSFCKTELDNNITNVNEAQRLAADTDKVTNATANSTESGVENNKHCNGDAENNAVTNTETTSELEEESRDTNTDSNIEDIPKITVTNADSNLEDIPEIVVTKADSNIEDNPEIIVTNADSNIEDDPETEVTNADATHDKMQQNMQENTAQIITSQESSTVNVDQIDECSALIKKMQERKWWINKRISTPEDVIPEVKFDDDVDLNLETYIGPSPCTILQTLTMSNANDFFNLERLETIGDSFLKFAITVYLYCTYPGIHEGKLSYLRSKQVSNYNLYKLGKKKGFPDCMIAVKFEPTENWLPPGYRIKKGNAFSGLNVFIASYGKNKGVNGEKEVKDENGMGHGTENGIAEGGSGMNKAVNGETEEDNSLGKILQQKQFNKELEEVIKMDDDTEKNTEDQLKCLIPYNLQTQHSLPDKSIADCVEALIGCYLTSCGQTAALQFMSWVGLKVLPEFKETENNVIVTKSKDTEKNEKHIPPKSSAKKVFVSLQCPTSPLLAHVPHAEKILNHLLNGFESFEETIHYKFRDRAYLLQAFTHASYHYNTVTDCYQRLEFLGDAILDYVITRHLFEDKKKHSPGTLTDLRSALVNNNIFAALAVKWNFHKYFRAVSPQLFVVIEKFVAWQKDREDEICLDEEFGDFDEEKEDEGEEIEIPKALGDIFESVAGAVYLDSGMSLDTVWKVYYRMMKPQIDAFTAKIPKSPVRELLEMEPETAKFEKPDRTMDGKIRVTVNVVGKGNYKGVGRNYRIAKSAAAKKALKGIRMINLHMAKMAALPPGVYMPNVVFGQSAL